MGWKGGLMFGPLGHFVEELLTKDASEDVHDTDSVSETEVARIQKLIEDGRRRGVSNIEIEISEDFSRDLEVNAGTTLENIPISVGAKVNRNRDGKLILKVDYFPAELTDKIRELYQLHKEGMLTDEEFSTAKQKILLSI